MYTKTVPLESVTSPMKMTGLRQESIEDAFAVSSLGDPMNDSSTNWDEKWSRKGGKIMDSCMRDEVQVPVVDQVKISNIMQNKEV